MPGPSNRLTATSRLARSLAGLLLLAVMLVLAIRFARSQNWQFQSLSLADWPMLAGVAASLLGVMLINGFIFREFVASFGAYLNVRSWVGLSLVGSLLNMVSPVRGGAALRALYLKRVHDVPFGEIGTVLLGSTLCSFAVTAGLGAAAIAVLGVPGGAYGWIALIFSALLALGLSMAFVVPLPRAVLGGLPTGLARLSNAWRSLGQQPTLLRRVFGWNILAALLHAFAFVLAFAATASTESWLVPVVSSAFARMGTLLAITPAGLGIFEAFGVVSATVVGAEAGPALIAVIIVRLAGACVTLAGGLIMLPMLILDSSVAATPSNSAQRSVRP